MMKMNYAFTLAIIACFTLPGCGDAPPAKPQAASSHDGHDHEHDHDHEEGAGHHDTLADAVSDITAKRDAIKTAMEADDLKTADGPVHAIGHVLEDLEALAKKQGLEGEQLAQVTTARDALFEAFAGLDQTIHGKTDGKTWADVSEAIDNAVSQLQELTADSPAVEEPAPTEEEATPASEEAAS